jgi:hypothetical protein
VGGINAAGDSSSSSSPSINASTVVGGLASSAKLQSATQLDAGVLKRWLERDWNVTMAVDEAFNASNPYASSSIASASQQPSRRPSVTPVNGLGVGGASLVNGSNASSASLSRGGRLSMQVPSTGVNELREALGTASPVSAKHTNGLSHDSAAGPADLEGRRAHRRESRRGPMLGSSNGTNGTSAVAILDSLKVGEEQDASLLGPDSARTAKTASSTTAATPISPPYAS